MSIRASKSKYQDLINEQLAASHLSPTMFALPSLPVSATGDNSPTTENDGEDYDGQGQIGIHDMNMSFESAEEIVLPKFSYFETRSDKEKRQYVLSFCDILGRIKTNHHFRCKGCGDTFVGQYLNMLVHMAGTFSCLSVRTRECKMPIPSIREKIQRDIANYFPTDGHEPPQKKFKMEFGGAFHYTTTYYVHFFCQIFLCS